MDGAGPKIGICCCCCLTVVALIVVLISVGTVEPIEYGLKYNSVSKTVGEDVYKGGWYFIGPTYSFITFPATKVNMDFNTFPGAKHPPLAVKDKGGQNIQLSLSIQYKLVPDKVKELYSEFQKDYETRMVSYIDSTARDVCKQLNKDAFWSKENGNAGRKANGEALLKAINEVTFSKLYINVTELQIIHVGLQQAQEQGLIDTQLATQTAKTKQKELEAQKVRSSIEVNKQDAIKNITIIQGDANATGTSFASDAQKARTQRELQVMKDAYKELIDATQIQGDDLTKFIFYNDLQTADVDVMYATSNAWVGMKSAKYR